LTPVIYIAETLSLDKLYEFIDKEKREVLPTLISIWWFYIKVQRTCFSIYINDNRRVSVLQEKEGYGNEPYYWYCYCFWLRVF
jgi:hypothetical protein